MSDIDRVIKASRKIESELVRNFQAKGKGLNGKLNSVERKLPAALVKRIRYIATIRNKVVHDEGYRRIDDRQSFKRAVFEVQRELRSYQKSPSWQQRLIGGLVLLFIAVLVYLFFFRESKPEGFWENLRYWMGV
jgi:hypothetical protein